MDYIYKIFGFKYEVGLSTRPESYLGDLELWEKSENMMKEALIKFKRPFNVKKGEGGGTSGKTSPRYIFDIK